MEPKDEVDANDQSEQNYIYLCVQFNYNKNVREIGAAIVNLNERKLLLTEFQDNEHFSNFESLILQMNPQNSYTKFTLLINYPALSTEKAKIRDILNVSDVDAKEKTKNDFKDKGFEKDIELLLNRPLKQYLNETTMNTAMSSLACAITHLKLSDEPSNHQQFKLESYRLTNYMKLDLAAINALSIFPKNFEEKKGSEAGTLVDLLDKCKTQIGSRCLRRWLKQPLQDPNEINRRLDIVNVFVQETSLRDEIGNDFLRKIPDLDKLYTKFYKVHSNKKHSGSLVDCIKVYQLVKNLRVITNILAKNEKESTNILKENYLDPFVVCLKDFEKLEEMIEKAIDLEKAKEGEYLIRPQFSSKLKDLSNEICKILKDIENLKKSAENDLGIEVKLVDSNTHTYLFEVPKKNGDQAFRHSSKKYKQISIKNNKISFNNDKLVELCAHYCDFMSQYKEEQNTVVEKILNVVSTYYPAMENSAVIISELDVLLTFAAISTNAPKPYKKPIINTMGGNLILKDSRHPCLEMTDRQNCVANDCEMFPDKSKLHIITGPNMGGKSTYIRQVAICVLMAHVGCFVPCESAEIPIVDAVITRVGASDMQLRGISTFMSEMLEASCMLKIGTKNSLIIIDELGRGTSTSEGFGLAWAIAQYIVENLNSYCLFATHFHEMTMMEGKIPGVKNYYVSAIIKAGKLTMLYKVKPGAVDRSYGLFVAEMLNFPEKILNDAKRKSHELENYENFVTQNAQRGSDMEIEEEMETKKEAEEISTVTGNAELYMLGKNASLQQKINVIRIYEEFQNDMKDHKITQEDRESRLIDLKNKVSEVLNKKF